MTARAGPRATCAYPMLRSQGPAASSAPEAPSPDKNARRLNVTLMGAPSCRAAVCPCERRGAYQFSSGNVHGRAWPQNSGDNAFGGHADGGENQVISCAAM